MAEMMLSDDGCWLENVIDIDFVVFTLRTAIFLHAIVILMLMLMCMATETVQTFKSQVVFKSKLLGFKSRCKTLAE